MPPKIGDKEDNKPALPLSPDSNSSSVFSLNLDGISIEEESSTEPLPSPGSSLPSDLINDLKNIFKNEDIEIVLGATGSLQFKGVNINIKDITQAKLAPFGIDLRAMPVSQSDPLGIEIPARYLELCQQLIAPQRANTNVIMQNNRALEIAGDLFGTHLLGSLAERGGREMNPDPVIASFFYGQARKKGLLLAENNLATLFNQNPNNKGTAFYAFFGLENPAAPPGLIEAFTKLINENNSSNPTPFDEALEKQNWGKIKTFLPEDVYTAAVKRKNNLFPAHTVDADDATGTITAPGNGSTSPPPPSPKPPPRKDKPILDTSQLHPNLLVYAELANHYHLQTGLAQGSWAQVDTLAQNLKNCHTLSANLKNDRLTQSDQIPQPQRQQVLSILAECITHYEKLQASGPTITYLFCNQQFNSNSAQEITTLKDELKSITQREPKLDHLAEGYVLASVIVDTEKSAFVQGTHKSDNSFTSDAYITKSLMADKDKLKEFVMSQIESFKADKRSFGETMKFSGNFTKEYMIEALSYCQLRGYKYEVDLKLANKVLTNVTIDATKTEAEWSLFLNAQNKQPFAKLLSDSQLKKRESYLKLAPLNQPELQAKEAAIDNLIQKKPPAAIVKIGVKRSIIIKNPLKPQTQGPAPTSKPFSPQEVKDLTYAMQNNLCNDKPPFEGTSLDKDTVLKERIQACQRTVRVHVSPAWQTWASQNNKSLSNVMQFTNPGYADIKNSANLKTLKNKGLLAPDSNPNSNKDRVYSKLRVITADVVLLNDPDFKTVSVMTTAAPNLMGSSPGDSKEFTPKGIFNEAKYKTACVEQANLICRAAKEQGFTKIGMPDFGLGVYLNTLDDSEKLKAREAMLTAFSKAALDHNIAIDWIIYDQDPNCQKNIADSQSAGNAKFIIKTGDLLLEMKEAAKSGQNITFINPGSDRTIGGNFTADNPKTLEEQIAQQTSLLASMSVCFNPQIKDEYEKVINMTSDQVCVPPEKERSDNTFVNPPHSIVSSQGQSHSIQTLQMFQNGLTYVPFYDSKFENYIFANYAKEKLTGLDKVEYQTPEHYFQAQKFKDFPDLGKLFLDNNLSSDGARKLAEDIFKNPIKYKRTVADIDQIKNQWFGKNDYEAMLNVIRARCSSNSEFLSKLTLTGTAYILEDTYTGPKGKADSKWGGGPDGLGQNLLGKALMQVRVEKQTGVSPLSPSALKEFNSDFIVKTNLARRERQVVDSLLKTISDHPQNEEDNRIKKEFDKNTPLSLAQRYVRANTCMQKEVICQSHNLQWNKVATPPHQPHPARAPTPLIRI